MILYKEEQQQFHIICERLQRDSLGKAIFLIAADGQLLASAGRAESIDTTALASLVAGTMSASGGLAGLVGEQDFPTHYYEGQSGSIYSAKVTSELILTVVFDENASLGLVRLRVKRAMPGLRSVQEDVEQRASTHQGFDAFSDLELDDDTIDGFFSDAW